MSTAHDPAKDDLVPVKLIGGERLLQCQNLTRALQKYANIAVIERSFWLPDVILDDRACVIVQFYHDVRTIDSIAAWLLGGLAKFSMCWVIFQAFDSRR